MHMHPLTAINLQGEGGEVTIASGPVVIENGKVLLDKHGDDEFWKFPGGRLSEDLSLKENAIQKGHEELGLNLELISEPFTVAFMRGSAHVILIHYLAKRTNTEVTPGSHIKEWAWHDIGNLPEDCAKNIQPVINHFT